MNTFKWIIATVLLTGCLQTTKAEQPKEIQTVQATRNAYIPRGKTMGHSKATRTQKTQNLSSLHQK